eukprot:jgi/Psemu1/298760/fgenesh1_pm.725_\
MRGKSTLISSSTNPFDIMGIPRDSYADVVRTTFLQLAMRYHPDTSGKDTREDFQRIRDAFDKITKFGDQKSKNKAWLTEEVFNKWFEEHTGLRMDAATRREVMIAYRDGACSNSHSRTRYLPPAWQIAFILEEEGLFTKKLSGINRAVEYQTSPPSGSRRKRGF